MSEHRWLTLLAARDITNMARYTYKLLRVMLRVYRWMYVFCQNTSDHIYMYIYVPQVRGSLTLAPIIQRKCCVEATSVGLIHARSNKLLASFWYSSVPPSVILVRLKLCWACKASMLRFTHGCRWLTSTRCYCQSKTRIRWISYCLFAKTSLDPKANQNLPTLLVFAWIITYDTYIGWNLACANNTNVFTLF